MPHEPESTISAITTRTVAGRHYVIITDHNGRTHRLRSTVPAIDLINRLDTASLCIEVTDDDRREINDRLFTELLEALSQPPTDIDIDSFVVSGRRWELDRFPDVEVRARRGEDVLAASVARTMIDQITDGDLINELKELGGSDQLFEATWSVLVTRPEHSTGGTSA